MTLLETILLIEQVASAQPSINMIVENDVYKLNDCPDALYGVFAFVQGQHSGSISSDFITYNFTLFYVDRMTADHHNQLEAQSVGVTTLDNILRLLDEAGCEIDSYQFTPFSQRFADDCAGVYVQVGLSVLNTPCGEAFTTNDNIKII